MAVYLIFTDEGTDIQNFTFQLVDLKKINPSFVPEQLSKISFVFDKTETGTVLIRDIGIRDDEITLR